MTHACTRVISKLGTRGDSEDCCADYCGVTADFLDFCKCYHSVVVDIQFMIISDNHFLDRCVTWM